MRYQIELLLKANSVAVYLDLSHIVVEFTPLLGIICPSVNVTHLSSEVSVLILRVKLLLSTTDMGKEVE